MKLYINCMMYNTRAHHLEPAAQLVACFHLHALPLSISIPTLTYTGYDVV